MGRRRFDQENAPAGVADTVAELGRNIRAARMRRDLREVDVAEMGDITRNTLRNVEAGALGTGIGAYVAILRTMGMHGAIRRIGREEYPGFERLDETRSKRRVKAPQLESPYEDSWTEAMRELLE